MSAETVADHYNAVPQTGVGLRTESRIFYMRNLNNWIKSSLINDICGRLRSEGVRNPRVLDIGCGKGGDLRKWKIANVDSVVMADVAAVSIEQAKGRHEEMKQRERRGMFEADFVVADCTTADLAKEYDNTKKFDLSSCQFSLHYSFVDESSARRFLRNCVENVKPGGYFIGTLPDADRIVWAAREHGGEFKNAVCSVRYDNIDELQNPPLFGAKFHFTLDSQVNCPEFLAYFPLLEHLLSELDMDLVYCKKFPEAIAYFQPEGRGLMGRMQALEPYPPAVDVKLMGEEGEGEYREAEKKREELGEELHKGLGTLSKSEWEAVSMYLVFAFRKRGGDTVSSDATTVPTQEMNTAPDDTKNGTPTTAADEEKITEEAVESSEMCEKESTVE